MNGIIEITVPSGKKRLVMNYYATMEFEQAFFKNTTGNNAKIFTDLVYSGMYGEAMLSYTQMPTYQEAVMLVSEMADQDNFDEVSLEIWDTYNQSKWGKDFQKRAVEFALEQKKKAETPEVKTKKK